MVIKITFKKKICIHKLIYISRRSLSNCQKVAKRFVVSCISLICFIINCYIKMFHFLFVICSQNKYNESSIITTCHISSGILTNSLHADTLR